MPSWPLQHLPRVGLVITPQDGRLRTATATGPVKMRRRYTSVVRDWNFMLGPIDGGVKAALETFYTSTTSEGTVAFTWTDETGATQTFRFAEPPVYRQVVGHHVHTLKLYEVTVHLEQIVT